MIPVHSTRGGDEAGGPVTWIAYNTGRWYSEHGQRIAAKVTHDGGILFLDVDRGIEGYLTKLTVDRLELKLTPNDVMWAYDRPEQTLYWYDLQHWVQELQELRKVALAVPDAPR